MLDEVEYAQVTHLYGEAMRVNRDLRREKSLSTDAISLHERFRPVRDRYEELTGMKDCHQNAILHHRISLYGQPCERCNRPLRTPRAKLCGSCMFPVRQAAE